MAKISENMGGADLTATIAAGGQADLTLADVRVRLDLRGDDGCALRDWCDAVLRRMRELNLPTMVPETKGEPE